MKHKKRRQRPPNLEEVIAQLATWASSKTHVILAQPGGFFIVSLEGELHPDTDGRRNIFDFTALNNFFRAKIAPASCTSLFIQTDGGHVFVGLKGRRGEILLRQADHQPEGMSLLKFSGGRVN